MANPLENLEGSQTYTHQQTRSSSSSSSSTYVRGFGQGLHGDEGGDAIAVVEGEVRRLEEDQADGAVAGLGLQVCICGGAESCGGGRTRLNQTATEVFE